MSTSDIIITLMCYKWRGKMTKITHDDNNNWYDKVN